MQGRWRLVIGLPDALSRLMAFLLEFTPGPVMTRDNYRSLQADGTSAAAFPYGIRPRRIEDMAPAWLGRR
jgi:NADH dehydrogenase